MGNNILAGTNWWLGGTDAAVEGEWRWRSDSVLFSSGGALQTGIRLWSAGEPSNSGGTEHYLTINYLEGGYKDKAASSAFKYICEHPRMIYAFIAPNMEGG